MTELIPEIHASVTSSTQRWIWLVIWTPLVGSGLLLLSGGIFLLLIG